MQTIHYDDTPDPVGLPMGLNGNRESYLLGFYDGGDYGEQYADDPEAGVIFESPQAARGWLAAVTKVLEPYIASGDRESRVPNPSGWEAD